ncbi:class I adenylate-forming enzyme family protein [Janibacter corallicola]|uniref:class I adenylate-forming enzyme family protein n=1 Tax=Janibacter corallicola TaxID=415212 RepID=UPI000A057D06|nr:acyl-CoA synthetase [Janibacter corallicola]
MDECVCRATGERWPVEPVPGEAVPTPFGMSAYCVADPRARAPERTALVLVHGEGESRWTFAEVDDTVRAVAAGLLGLGLEPGDRVMLRMGNRAEFPFVFFGAIAAGLVAVPTSAQLTGQEAAGLLRDCGARAVALDPDLELDLPDGVHRVTAATIEEWVVGPARAEHDVGDPDRPAFITYTSGTTGRPKGVTHAHRSAWGRRPMYHGWYGLTEGDVVLHAGALNWTYTLGVGLTDPWANAATAVVYDGPRDGLVWPRIVASHAATHLAAVPGVYRHLLRHGDPGQWDLSSLRAALVAGEALPTALWHEWLERTGVPLYESLGMSEISTFVSSGPQTPVRPGSPGRAQPGRRIGVLDPESPDRPRELPAGEVGRLAVHRSDPGLMLGYWQRPEEDAEVLRGEWFVTSDLAAVDEEGYLTYHGRADDVMNAMGYRVSPVEVEDALAGTPGVAEVAAAALDVGDGVSIVCAWVVPTGDPEGVRERVLAEAERLAPYKRPREVRLVPSLPRTGNGKVIRRALSGHPAGSGPDGSRRA